MGGGAPQPRLREVTAPVVAKSNHAPLNLVLIQTQHCPSGTAILSDRALQSRPHSSTSPLGTELNRVSPSSRSYRIYKHSVNATPPPLPTSGAHPIVYQKPFYACAWYPLLKNRSSIITSPLIRGMSEWVSGEGPVAPWRVPCLAGVKATHALVGDKTLKPGRLRWGNAGVPGPLVVLPSATLGITAHTASPARMRGRACDLDVELGPAFHVTVEGTGLFVRPSLRDLSSNRRKPGWLQPLETLPLFSTKGSRAP